MADHSNIQTAASKSIRPFRSSEEYLYAMKEDLAEWLNTLYNLDIQVENFMDVLETGYDLCRHANNVSRMALEFQQLNPEAAFRMKLPQKEVIFQAKNVVPGSFIARDNISNFIQWCRQELGIQDVLMFETNDLVLKKNEKNFVLCLLEVARKGSKLGMLAPMLIQMEEEIEEEIRDQVACGELETEQEIQDLGPKAPLHPNRTQRITLCDLRNLDELVREILSHCTCPSQFPMVKVSEGKYQVGDSNVLIFVRVLRSHVMVRVGGGWDTLEHYLDKHDPCRCASFAHRLTQTRGVGFSPQKTAGPGSPQANSPSTQRRAEVMSVVHDISEPLRLGEKRLSAGGDCNQAKANRPGPPIKGPGVTPLPRLGSFAPSAGKCGASSQSCPSSSKGCTSQGHQDIGDSHLFNSVRSPRARRLSGDSDSSSSSMQSGTLGRRRDEDSSLVLRKEAGRRISEGPSSRVRGNPKRQPTSRSQSRDRLGLSKAASVPGRTELEERGRPRMTNQPIKPGVQTPRPRARSQGRVAGDPMLLISRAKDGQHSWTRAEEPKEILGSSGRASPRAKSPTRGYLTSAGSRGPALNKHNGSLPTPKMTNLPAPIPLSASGRQRQPCLTGSNWTIRQSQFGETSRQSAESLGQELEATARTFLTPLRLDPSQEQQLFQRLEEEFLANSQMMGLEEDEELEPVDSGSWGCDGPRLLHVNPDQGAADSAYCSSSSSSSSLNIFNKFVLQPEAKDEPKRNGAFPRTWASEASPVPVDIQNGSADAADPWDLAGPPEQIGRRRKPVVSSSSDESNCCVGLNDLEEVQEALELPEPLVDSPWASEELASSNVELRSMIQDVPETLGKNPGVSEVVLRLKSALQTSDRVASTYKLKLLSAIKPRADSQPDKTPSRIPTPLSYKASRADKPPTGRAASKDGPAQPPSRVALHSVISSVEPSGGPGESGVVDEGA